MIIFPDQKRQLLSFVILIFLISAGFHTQAQDCKRFRNGNFKITYDNIGTIIIKRSGNIQTETVPAKKMTMVFRVRWINDCTYTLTPTGETLQKYANIPMNAVITVQITKTSKNSYSQTSKANYLKEPISGEVVKIN